MNKEEYEQTISELLIQIKENLNVDDKTADVFGCFILDLIRVLNRHNVNRDEVSRLLRIFEICIFKLTKIDPSMIRKSITVMLNHAFLLSTEKLQSEQHYH